MMHSFLLYKLPKSKQMIQQYSITICNPSKKKKKKEMKELFRTDFSFILT